MVDSTKNKNRDSTKGKNFLSWKLMFITLKKKINIALDTHVKIVMHQWPLLNIAIENIASNFPQYPEIKIGL